MTSMLGYESKERGIGKLQELRQQEIDQSMITALTEQDSHESKNLSLIDRCTSMLTLSYLQTRMSYRTLAPS